MKVIGFSYLQNGSQFVCWLCSLQRPPARRPPVLPDRRRPLWHLHTQGRQTGAAGQQPQVGPVTVRLVLKEAESQSRAIEANSSAVRLPVSSRKPFRDFATSAAIRCTELYEYCQTLGGSSFSIPSFQVKSPEDPLAFSTVAGPTGCGSPPHCLLLLCCVQVYKLLYASRLLDCGLPSQAFHYCELVGRALLRQAEPHAVLTAELIKVPGHLRRFTAG